MESFYSHRLTQSLGPAFIFAAALSIHQSAHAQQEYTLSPEVSQGFIQSYGMSAVEVFPVSYTEVDYHTLDTVQVESKQYKYMQDLLAKYQPDYDRYVADNTSYAMKKGSQSEVIAYLDQFLSSSEKYKVKEKYLKQAEEKAQANGLQGILTWHKSQNKPSNDTERVLSLVSGSKLDNQEVQKYKQNLQSMSIARPQESYNYTEYVRVSKEIESVNKTERGLAKSANVGKRKAYILGEQAVPVSSLTGKFTEMPNYRMAKKDIEEKFVKNELSDDLRGVYLTSQFEQPYSMLKQQGTGEFYYVRSTDFLNYVDRANTKQELSELVHKLGYTPQVDEYGVAYIKSKTSEISMNSRTLAELKRDPQYITKLDADQQKIATLVQQTIPHSKKLDQYLSTYNIKRSRMPAADLKAWRTATASAQKLQDQIRAISKKYDGNTSFSLLKKSNTQNEFLDNLLASKGVLGM